MLGVVRGGTGAPSGMRTFPLLFNVFFAAILLVVLERFSKESRHTRGFHPIRTAVESWP